MVQKHTVEFNQLAMANSEGSEAMLNRVMTKDNIGVAVLLELRKKLIEMSCKSHFVNVFNRWYFVNKKKITFVMVNKRN